MVVDTKTHDVFVSYDSRDRAQVEPVARVLEELGLSVYFYEWYLVPGRPWRQGLEEALHGSRTVAVFVGAQAGGLGRWQLREVDLALDLQTKDPSLAVIPVLLPGADPPLGFLSMNTWVDLRKDRSDREAVRALAAAARGESPLEGHQDRSEAAVAAVSPYRGLRPFREEDASFFFGREEFTDRLVDLVRRSSLVAVVGPSGSGKSSVVRAGLAPSLRRDSAQVWDLCEMVPGQRPFDGLAAALIPLLEPDLSETDRLVEVGKLANYVAEGQVKLEDVVQRILKKQLGTDRLLLMVDQWEELYTLTTGDDTRRNFVDLILRATEDGPLSVVLTLRGDFYGQALQHRLLADRLQGVVVNLSTMTEQELERAIVKPAEQVDLVFEPGLVPLILSDVGDEPGNLPLLEFVLDELWQQRRDGLLLHETYRSIGGVHGAMARRADETVDALLPDERDDIRRIFLHLVRPGAGTEDTRRRATFNDMGEESRPLVRLLADDRLLVTGRDLSTGEETVEVAHEALIHNWGRLRGWIEVDRDFLTWRERLRSARSMWLHADEDEGALLRGAPLAEANRWIEERPGDVESNEARFVEASNRLHQRARIRERRRVRTIIGGSIVAAVLTVGLAVLALFQIQERAASEDRLDLEKAATEERTAEALLGEGRLLTPRQPELAAIALLESYQLVNDPRTVAAMGDILMGSQRRESYEPVGGSAALAAHPSDGLLAVGTGTGDILLVDLPSLRPVGDPLQGLEKSVRRVAFSADGSMVAGVDADGGVFVWDVESRAQVLGKPSEADARSLRGLSFASADDELVTADRDGHIRFWNLDDSSIRLEIAATTRSTGLTDIEWNEMAVHPTQPVVVTGSRDGDIAWWHSQSGELLTAVPGAHKGRIWAAAFTVDGRLLLTAGQDQVIRVWDGSSGEHVADVAGHTDEISSIAIHASGLVATGGFDQVRFWEVAPAGLNPVADPTGNTVAASSLAFNPDGSTLAVTNDKIVRLFDAVPGGQINTPIDAESGTVWSMEFDAAASNVVVVSNDAVRIWDATLSSLQNEWLDLGRTRWFARSPDGSRLAVGGAEGLATIINLETGEETDVLLHDDCGGCSVRALAWSPDGQQLASVSSNDSLIRILDVGSGTLLATDAPSPVDLPPISGRNRPQPEGFRSLAFTGDGLLLSGGMDGAIRVWDPDTGKELNAIRGHDLFVPDLAISPDGEQLASASEDQTVKLWNLSDLTESGSLGEEPDPIQTFARHTGAVYAVTFTPDGRYVASGGQDQMIRVWDPLSGEEAARYQGHFGSVRTVAFAPDGGRMLSGGTDGTMRIWDVSWEAWPALLCEWMQPPVSETDWSAVMGAEPFEPACDTGTP